MRSIMVVGAGPGLGTEIARRFGHEGFKTVISSRSRDRLQRTVAQLRDEGIDAHYVELDVTDDQSVARGFAEARSVVGEIHVLVFNPRVDYAPPYSAVDMDPATVRGFLDTAVLGSIRCARQVLPAMLDRGRGTILFTVGGSASAAVSMMAPVGVATAGVLNYADVLAAEVAERGVLVGAVTINVTIVPGTATSPELAAELYWNAHTRSGPRRQSFGRLQGARVVL